MTFPGAGASIIYNEAGEVCGWEYHYNDAPDIDLDRQADDECIIDDAWSHGVADREDGLDPAVEYGRQFPVRLRQEAQAAYLDGYGTVVTDCSYCAYNGGTVNTHNPVAHAENGDASEVAR